MPRFTALLAAALFALAGAAFASDTSKAADAAPAEKVADADKAQAETQRTPGATTNRPGYNKDEVVCQREKVTGSRFARTICHTREQWERMRKAGIEGVNNVQRAPIPIINE